MPPHELSGGGGGGGGSGSGGSSLSPPKPDKGKATLTLDGYLLDEDNELKERVELCVVMLQDSDPDVQEHALDTLRSDICPSKCAMDSVPKPIKFLCPHYDVLKDCYQKMSDSVIKRKMADILSALASAVEQLVSKVDVAMAAMDNERQVEVDRESESESQETDALDNIWANLHMDEDNELKERVELCVVILQDSDPDVQEHALDTLRSDICPSKCAMDSVPKPIKFLCPHYDVLKDCYQKMSDSVIKRKMADILSALASAVEQLVSKVDVAMAAIDTDGQVEGYKERESQKTDAKVAIPMESMWANLHLVEDIELKERVELCVVMLQDSDRNVQENALDTLYDIRSSKCAMDSMPKPIKFLCPHYDVLKDCYQKMSDSVIKRKLAVILSALASAVEQLVSKVDVVMAVDTEGQVEKDRESESKSQETDAEVAIPLESIWADLPRDLVAYVVSLLPCCRAERQPVSNLNRHWRRVIQFELPLPAALPWLVMPSSTDPFFHTCTHDGRWHNINITESVRKDARICGSTEGGWFVLAMEEPHHHQLFNFNSGDVFPLPRDMMINDELQAVTVKAAVLSGVPAPPYAYTVAAIVQLQESSVCLAMCKHLSFHWDCVTSLAGDLTIQDLLYFRDAFYLLTSDEDVVMLMMRDQGCQLRSLNVRERPNYFLDSMMYSTMHRYLCESGGDLYMVVKFLKDVTLEVRVFQLKVDPSALMLNYDGDEDERPSWVDVTESKELNDRVFFVGQASSRSFDTIEGGRIHFLDDRHAEAAPGEYLRDDMGIVSFIDMMINNFPPVGDAPLPPPTSDRDPSAWLLH